MAFPQGINFRATSGYVTDGTNETYEISFPINYPRTTPQGNNVGWESFSSGDMQVRDRNSGNDRRLAGCHFTTDAGMVATYRIDLPASGSYSVRIAAGDANYATNVAQDLRDTTTTVASITGDTTAANSFKDALNVEYTQANWPGNNTPTIETFGTTILRLVSTSAGNTRFTHIYVESSGPALSLLVPKNTLRPALFSPGIAR